MRITFPLRMHDALHLWPRRWSFTVSPSSVNDAYLRLFFSGVQTLHRLCTIGLRVAVRMRYAQSARGTERLKEITRPLFGCNIVTNHGLTRPPIIGTKLFRRTSSFDQTVVNTRLTQPAELNNRRTILSSNIGCAGKTARLKSTAFLLWLTHHPSPAGWGRRMSEECRLNPYSNWSTSTSIRHQIGFSMYSAPHPSSTSSLGSGVVLIDIYNSAASRSPRPFVSPPPLMLFLLGELALSDLISR